MSAVGDDRRDTTVELIALRDLLAADDRQGIAAHLEGLPDPDIADVLSDLDPEDMVRIFMVLESARQEEVFSYLEPEAVGPLVERLDDVLVRHLLASLPPDDRAALFTALPAKAAGCLRSLLSREDAAELQQLLSYPEDSVGRRMNPDFVAVRATWTVAQALAHIRAFGPRTEMVIVVFVVDSHGVLRDALRLRRLIFADPRSQVGDLMREEPCVRILVDSDQEEAVRLIRHYDLLSLPVVNDRGVLIGIFTIDDVMDVAEEEFTEDVHKLGSVGRIEGSFGEASPGLLFRRRIGWLVLLVLINLFAGGAIALYEDALDEVTALAFFMTLLIASGGNAGAQAATLVVRAFAIGDLRPRDWRRLLLRDLAVALGLGLCMATTLALLALVFAPEVLPVVCLTMVAVVVVGSLFGTLLPFILRRLRCDPATASAPLVTSLIDIGGLLIYFAIASWWLDLGAIGGGA